MVTPEGVVAPSSEAEAAALLRPVVERLRARGYAESEMRRPSVHLLSPATALAGVEWVRRDRDGGEIERFGATYLLFRGEDGWKITALSVHPPETLPELE